MSYCVFLALASFAVPQEEALTKLDDVSPASFAGEGWTRSKSFIETTATNSAAACEARLPPKARVEMLIANVVGRPTFEICLGAPNEQVSIEVWDDVLVARQGNTFVEVGSLEPDKQVWMGFGIDQEKQQIVFFDPSGKIQATLKSIGNLPDPRLAITNYGKHLALTGVRLGEWDGQPIQRTIEGEKPIYEGPDFGAGWSMSPKPRDGRLGFWSRRTQGGIACITSGKAFRPIPDLPDNVELRLVLEQRDAGLALGIEAGFRSGGAGSVRLLVRHEHREDAGKLIATSSDLPFGSGQNVLSDFPEIAGDFVVLRLFRKKLDEKKHRLTICAADGRKLEELTIVVEDAGAGRPGILFGTPGPQVTLSRVELFAWDGVAKPEPIPGGFESKTKKLDR